jgi:hypothetical protein
MSPALARCSHHELARTMASPCGHRAAPGRATSRRTPSPAAAAWAAPCRTTASCARPTGQQLAHPSSEQAGRPDLRVSKRKTQTYGEMEYMNATVTDAIAHFTSQSYSMNHATYVLSYSTRSTTVYLGNCMHRSPRNRRAARGHRRGRPAPSLTPLALRAPRAPAARTSHRPAHRLAGPAGRRPCRAGRRRQC